MRETVERELKLVPGEDFRLPDLGQPLPTRIFVSSYYDTRDLRLARRGVTLRHRLEDGTGLWQLKLPSGAARTELEEPGPPARPPDAFLELLVAHLRGAEPVRVARLRTRRQGVRADGAEVVEDSVTVYDGPRVKARFRELEIELVGGDEKILGRLERALRDAGAVRMPWRPKLHRALDLPAPARRFVPTAGTPPLDVLASALAEQHAALLEHDPGTRLGTDPEHAHQMRVATRRSRAFLRAARPLLDSGWAKELRAELGWLGSVLGPARDLDVLIEHFRTDPELDDDPDLRTFLSSLMRERRRAREGVLSALSDDRYFALLDRLEGVVPVPSSDAATSLAELWWDEFRRTRRRVATLGPKSTDEQLHAARIDVKRARYAAELAAYELGRPGQRFVDAAKRVQDILGEHQDACVAEERITVWAARKPGVSATAAQLVDRERARRKQARKEWSRAWAELERRGRKARP